MHILLIYSGGLRKQGLLLASSREHMRVMMPGMADVVEFRRVEGIWMGESGATVEIADAELLHAPRSEWMEEAAQRNWLTV